MNAGDRRFYIIFLLIIGGIFIFVHFKGKDQTKESTDTTLYLESGDNYPESRTLKLSQAGFYKIINLERAFAGKIDMQAYPLRFCFDGWLNSPVKTNEIPFYKDPFFVEEPCFLRIRFCHNYRKTKKAKLEIKELGKNYRGDRGLILQPGVFNSYEVKAQRGWRWELDQNYKELFYIRVYDENGSRAIAQLVPTKDKLDVQKSCCWIYSSNGGNGSIYFTFWEPCKVIFGGGEVPIFLKLNSYPSREKLYVNQKEFGPAHYMEGGEVYNTKIWLDWGDEVSISNGWFYLATENENWRHEKKYNSCKREGWLRIKAEGRARFNSLKVERNRKWGFRLGPGSIYNKIKVYQGDKLKICADGRYYLNDKMQEQGCFYWDFGEEKFLNFRGSLQAVDVKVYVIKRRGV